MTECKCPVQSDCCHRNIHMEGANGILSAEIERLTAENAALVNEINEAGELRLEGRSVEERNAKLLAANMRLTAEVKSAFFAGCDYGSEYAGDQYLGTPERQRGFDQWKSVSSRNCPHDPESWVELKDGEHIKYCGYKFCSECHALIAPDGVIFLRFPPDGSKQCQHTAPLGRHYTYG